MPLRRLTVRTPFAAAALLRFLAARAVPGVEEIRGTRYRRSLRLPEGPGIVDVELGAATVLVRTELTSAADEAGALARCRALLDLGADPAAIDGCLARDPSLAALVAGRPGLRSPGTVDAGEIAVRAVVGQQVSVAAARTILGRLAAALGEPAGDLRLFPSLERLAGLDPASLPMPRARGRALVALARDPASLDDLERIRGIGPWTADYVAMRRGDPDVLPAGDLAIRRALAARGVDGSAWAPYRSYATHHLWEAATVG